MYTVKQFADKVKVNPETVRRWIRYGWLDANKTSKRGGFYITENALKKFTSEHPKYSGVNSEMIKIGSKDESDIYKEISSINAEIETYTKILHEISCRINDLKKRSDELCKQMDSSEEICYVD